MTPPFATTCHYLMLANLSSPRLFSQLPWGGGVCSVGAQMVSWLMQVGATGEMADHMNATIKAGAFFAGGTYIARPTYFAIQILQWLAPG